MANNNECPNINATAAQIVQRGILNRECYEDLGIVTLIDVMKRVFHEQQSGKSRDPHIEEQWKMLTDIVNKKYPYQAKEIMKQISSNRPLHTRSIEEAKANELNALRKAELARAESPRKEFKPSGQTITTYLDGRKIISTRNGMIEYTNKMRQANIKNAKSTTDVSTIAPFTTTSKIIRVTRSNGTFHSDILHENSQKFIAEKVQTGNSRLFRITPVGDTYMIEYVSEERGISASSGKSTTPQGPIANKKWLQGGKCTRKRK